MVDPRPEPQGFSPPPVSSGGDTIPSPASSPNDNRSGAIAHVDAVAPTLGDGPKIKNQTDDPSRLNGEMERTLDARMEDRPAVLGMLGRSGRGGARGTRTGAVEDRRAVAPTLKARALVWLQGVLSDTSPTSRTRAMALWLLLLLATIFYAALGLKVSFITMLAAIGSSEAQNTLGGMFLKGEDVAGDPGEAFGWYFHAAEQGHVTAQLSVGRMYENGQGVSKNYSLASSWYRKAALQGNGDAAYLLALLYESRNGVSTDLLAIAWYRRAADQGVAPAARPLSKLCLRYAAAGEPIAQNCLGLLHTQGSYVRVDYWEAAALFEKAAWQENADAQHNLSVLYDKGHGVPQDFMSAYAWANVAASRASAETQSQYDKFRDAVAAKLSQQQLIEAQTLARELVESLEKRKAVDPKRP